MSSRTRGARAVVLGGGIAGLASAAALARHFDEVVVLEQDHYAPAPSVRTHTQQGAHVHLLLAGGLEKLTRLVPELPAWLDELGCPEGDLTHHTRVAHDGRWLPRTRSGIRIRTCTRAIVEHLLLRHARGLTNVSVREGVEVGGLRGERRIEGVRVGSEVVEADLVVDALGRGSPTPTWLAEQGHGSVEELSIDPGIVYSTALFEPPRDIDDDWTTLATLPTLPDAPRMGVLIRLGHDRLLASSISYGKPRSPRTAGELIARMEELPMSHLGRLLRASRPISEVMSYGRTRNRLRRFGRLASFPDGLVVVGDAVCALNPRYGQGMTVAALAVEHLDAQLAASAPSASGWSRAFQQSLEGLLETPWQIALAEDRQWVATDAERSSLAGRALAGLMGRSLKAAFADVDTYVRFMKVAQLMAPPTILATARTAFVLAKGPPSALAADEPGIGPR